MRSIELFAGAGGLCLGVSKAGFDHQLIIEWDKEACDTIRFNKERRIPHVGAWPDPLSQDVRAYDFKYFQDNIDLLAGGPPCQPFSLGGKHRAFLDKRDMFPQVARAVREIRPKSFLVENVKGLTRESFAKYFNYINLQLTYPELVTKADETWNEHLSRLEKYHTKGRRDGLYYNVVYRVLNAADYGVPQRRERVIIVGFRNDIHYEWSFPKPTHSWEKLVYDQWITGEYWEKHEVPKTKRPAMDHAARETAARLKDVLLPPAEKPWATVRDAISNLPEPAEFGAKDVFNHQLITGARTYAGHTGSPLDEPAKTLKAGDHGVPGGENMLAYPNGRVRYFTTRESARLQTFPDDFAFNSSWSRNMRQLGNAVPVELGRVVASSVRGCLLRQGSLELARV